MSHINGYQLVEEDNYQKFVLKVNGLLGEGWELHGPTQVIVTKAKTKLGSEYTMIYYYQAMVLLKKDTP